MENIAHYEQVMSRHQAAQARAIALKKEAEEFTIGPLADVTRENEHATGVLAKAESALAIVRDDLLRKKQAIEDTLKQEKEWQEKLGRVDTAAKQALKRFEDLSIELPNHARAAEDARQNHNKEQIQAGFWASAGNWLGFGPLASTRKAHEQAESVRKDTEKRLDVARQDQTNASEFAAKRRRLAFVARRGRLR